MATLQEKLREQSESNWVDYDQLEAKFKQHIMEFLKEDSKKLLVFETSNLSLDIWRMRQVLKLLKGRYEKSNQIFVKWEQLISIMGPLKLLPKLPNLMVLEFDKPMRENDRHVLCKLLKRLSMSVWKKTVVFSSENNFFQIFSRVDFDISLINISNANVETTSKQLLNAAAMGHLNDLIELLNNGVDINLTNEEKNTALHLAAEAGHRDVVVKLMAHGAKQLKNSTGNTPLHFAAHNGHNNVLTALLDKRHGGSTVSDGNINETNPNQNTALHLAARGGHRDSVLTLWRHGAQFLPDLQSNTPLHLAAMNGHNDVVATFLENDVDVDIKGKNGYMPLHCAAELGHNDVLLTLIEYGAKLHSTTARGWNALHLASRDGHLEIFRTLLEGNASNNSTLLSMKEQSGRTPLDIAIVFGRKSIVEYLKNRKA